MEDREREVRYLLEEAVKKLDKNDPFFEKVSKNSVMSYLDYQRRKEMGLTLSCDRLSQEVREERAERKEWEGWREWEKEKQKWLHKSFDEY
jgi:hypothetical protein